MNYCDWQLHAEKSLNEVDAVSLLKSFQINTLGHLLVYKHFASLIPERLKAKHSESSSIFTEDDGDVSNGILPKDQATLVSFSARVGSIADNKKGGYVPSLVAPVLRTAHYSPPPLASSQLVLLPLLQSSNEPNNPYALT